MIKQRLYTSRLVVVLVSLAVMSSALEAQRDTAPQPMSFFITSVGLGNGGHLGGLEGADAHCQSLADAVGRSNATWRAYLSTQGPNAVNARDRIGNGPWYAHGGRRMIASDQNWLHGDTLQQARLGNAIGKMIALTETGNPVNGLGDSPNQHDILTGSQADGLVYTDGEDHTCSNWTSDSDGSAQVGHSDTHGGGNSSWNSSHASRGCSQENLISTGGAGYFYCFAVE